MRIVLSDYFVTSRAPATVTMYSIPDGEIRVVHVHIVAPATRHEEQAVGCLQCPVQFVIHCQPETGFSD